MRGFQDRPRTAAVDAQLYQLAGLAFHTSDTSVCEDVDPLVAEQPVQGFRNVLILAMEEASVAINHRDPAVKAAHCLGQFEADKPTAQHEEMFRNAIQFQGFDVRQGICFSKTWRRLDSRTGSRVDDNPLPVKYAN